MTTRLILLVLVLWLAAVFPAAQSAPALRLVATIGLPGVSGRIDHLAFDAAHQRLLVAALGNGTVEVVGTERHVFVRSLPGFHEPQGIATVPDLSAVAVANGGTGTLQLLDAASYQVRWTAPVGGDADNVRYDANARRLWVAATGGLYGVQPSDGAVTGKVPIDGHPESFQLQAGGSRVYANLPGASPSQVVTGDRAALAVAARWTSLGCSGNYPMALDEPASRLFIGCRRPARLVMLDTSSGAALTSVDIVGDTDDLFIDAARGRLYVIGGEGFVDVIGRARDTLTRVDRIATRAGARTGLWVPSLSRLYVAVPARDGLGAELRVFQAS